MDLDHVSKGLEMVVKTGGWTEELRDWIYPKIKRDPSYMERAQKHYGDR